MNFLDLIYPKCCVGCGRFGRYICARCSSVIRIIELREMICPVCEKPAIDGYTHPRCKTRYTPDGLTSFFHYDGAVRKAIQSIKYRFVSDLAHEFVALVPNECLTPLTLNSEPRTFFVPIPLHGNRYRERGFNQAEVMGRLLAARLHIPIRTDILLRTRQNQPQVEMKHRSDRLKNMENVFSVNTVTMKQCDSVTVLLFDDVFTTGATMRAAANALKRAGAAFVWCVTMAR